MRTRDNESSVESSVGGRNHKPHLRAENRLEAALSKRDGNGQTQAEVMGITSLIIAYQRESKRKTVARALRSPGQNVKMGCEAIDMWK